MIVYAHDNQYKPSVTGMELRYMVWDNTGYLSVPETIPGTYDNKMQMDPQIAFDKNGNLICVFIQTDSSITESSTLEDAFEATEIAYCTWDGSSGQWSDVQEVTNNNRMDVSPVLSSNSEGDLVLVWASDNDLNHRTINDRSLFALFWDGNSWSIETQLVTNEPIASGPKVALDENNNAICVFSCDGDENATTTIDQNIFSISFNTDVVNDALQLTTNYDYQDTSPSVIYGSDGGAYVVWSRKKFQSQNEESIYDENLYYKKIGDSSSAIKITNGTVYEPMVIKSEGSISRDTKFMLGWKEGHNPHDITLAEVKMDDSVEYNTFHASNSKMSMLQWNFGSDATTLIGIKRDEIKNGGKNCNLSIYSTSSHYEPEINITKISGGIGITSKLLKK